MPLLLFSIVGFFVFPSGESAGLTRVQATLEDMEGEKLMTVATHGETTLIVTWRGRLQKSFFLLNLTSGRLWQIQDQRINFFGLFRAFPTKNGFALVDQKTLRLMFLNPSASPLGNDSIQEFEGFEGMVRVRHIETLPQQRLLITYQNYNEEGWFLAEADIEKRSFEIVHHEPIKSSEKVFWAQQGSHRYRVDRETGAIALQRENGFHQTLLPGREKVKKPHFSRTQGYPGLPKYQALLGNEVQGNDFLCFTLFDFDGYQPGKTPGKSLLFVQGTSFREAPHHSTIPIAVGKTNQLHYNPEERLFQRIKTPSLASSQYVNEKATR